MKYRIFRTTIIGVLTLLTGSSCTTTDVPTEWGVIAAPYRATKSLVVTATLGVSNSNTGAGSTSLTLPATKGYQIRVSGFITRTRIPDGATFQFGPFGQGGCNSSTIKVYDPRGLRAASSMAGDCSYTNYQRSEWVANVNLASPVTVSRDGGTTSCSPQWPLNPCFVYTGSQTVSIIPLTDTNTPTVSLVADRAQVNVGDTVTFTATVGPPGQPTAVSDWQWTHDNSVMPWDTVQSPSVSCTGTICKYTPTRSGTMTVTASLRGASVSASATVDVGCLFPTAADTAPWLQALLPVLNSRPVRDSLNLLYHASGADSANAGDRREHGLFVHQNTQGQLAIQMVRPNPNDLGDGPCSLTMTSAPPSGYTLVLSAHIHPFLVGNRIPCRIRKGSNVLVRYGLGPTKLIQSGNDWAAIYGAGSGLRTGVVLDVSRVAVFQLGTGMTINLGPTRIDPVTHDTTQTYTFANYSDSNQVQRARTGVCTWPGR